MVNTGNVGVSWSGVIENGLQQNGFENFHFLLMKTHYIQVFFFSVLITFYSCSEAVGINKRVSLKILNLGQLKLFCFLCASIRLKYFHFTAIS